MRRRLPYSRQTLDAADIAAVVQVLQSDLLTTGPMVDAFERELALRTGARYAVVFNSGTSALHGAYFAAGLGPGDEVITTPITFAATANAALYLGAVPVFADVQPDTINLDPEAVRAKLSERTRVIAPVDFAGHPADLDEIRHIASEAGAVVVEDACHALGAWYKERPVGSIADMTVFSFHPVKAITSGEGGAVVTNNPMYAEKLRLFRNHGITKDPAKMSRYEGPWSAEMHLLGYNYRLSDIHAALGLSQLRKLECFIARRQTLAQAYDRALAPLALQRPGRRPYVEHAWHLYTVQLQDAKQRRRVFDALHAQGIAVQVHYPPVYRHPYYQQRGYGAVRCPRAEEYASRCLSLPLFPGLTDEDIERVVDALARALDSDRRTDETGGRR